ncbi:MAG: DUF1343 domain-containing protein [Woeseiaceae bacterium]
MNRSLLLLAGLLVLSLRAAAGEVLTGIDVLERAGFESLAGQRVGLITNHTGRARDGRSTAAILRATPRVQLVRLFSPEHGPRGQLDEATIGDSIDPATGIPVVSLYGEHRRPTADMLEGLDTLVFDIQDIGTRFYTYISTMGEAMVAAAGHGQRFVVLDRPNPINGVDVAGPVLDDGKQSFVGFHTLPVRHGLTIGELALLFRAELGLDLDLHVVRIAGWRRADWFDETGLAWVDPSPNMRSLAAATLYPGIGLLETTNMSVGRGTATPFELIGAPWLDADEFAASLEELALPGIRFAPVHFTPDASTFAGERCHGVRFTLTDRDRFEPVRTGLAIATLLVRDYREHWQTDRYIRLLGNEAALAALLAGDDVAGIRQTYEEGLAAFRQRRATYLLYD